MKATARRREGYAHEVEIEGGHRLVFDEPIEAGGADEVPDQVVAAALAACTAITVEMYAGHKGWDLGEVEVEADLEPGPKGSIELFAVTLRVPPLDDEQRRRLLVIAGKCPVHRALAAETEVTIENRIESR